MASTKITNRFALLYAMQRVEDEEIKAKLNSMIEAIDRKNSAPRKPTAVQIANEELKKSIVQFLTYNSTNFYTVSELIKSVDELNGLSSQKVTALLRQLRDSKKVKSFTEKRRTVFQIID